MFTLASPTGTGTWIYDRSTGALLPLTAPLGFVDPVFLFDRRIAFLVGERQAGLDLDGDGQRLDNVLHVFDARSGVTASTGRAAYSQPQMDEHRVVFIGLSNPPLDRDHRSILVQDLRTGVVSDTQLPATNFRLEDERILALVFEASVGFDLNGDGDFFDSVLEVYDLRAGITFDTGLAVDFSEFASIELDGEVLVLSQDDRLKAVRMR